MHLGIIDLVIPVAKVSTLSVHHLPNSNIRLDVEGRQLIVQGCILPATGRFNIGSMVQGRTTDIVETVDRILLLPLPPNTVNVHMMHEEDRVTGGGLYISHLKGDLVSKG